MRKRYYHRLSVLWGVGAIFVGLSITFSCVKWLSDVYWLKLYADEHYVCQPGVMCHTPYPENYRLLGELITYVSGYFAAGFAVAALLIMALTLLIEILLFRKSRGHHEHR